MTESNVSRGTDRPNAFSRRPAAWTIRLTLLAALTGGSLPGHAQKAEPTVRAPGDIGTVQNETQPAPAAPAPPDAPGKTASTAPTPAAPGVVPKDLFDKVAAFANKRDYPGALAFIDKTMADQGPSAALMILRGRVNIDAKQPDLSLADMNRAVELDKNSAESFLWRARVRAFELPLTRDNVTAAHADFAEAERLDAKKAATYYYRGRFYAATNEADKALSHYDQALARDPKYADAHRSKTIALYERGNFDAALKSATDAVTNAPNESAPYAIRGLVMLSRKDDAGARADIAKAVSLARGFEFYTSLGVTALSAAAVFDRNGSIIRGGAR